MTRLFYAWYEKPELPHGFQVEDSAPRFTGLLDGNGNKIYADANPIGFVTDFTPAKPRIRVRAGRQVI